MNSLVFFTAKDVLNENTVDSIVHLDEGFRIFRTIRNSPTYFQKRQKDIFAMIRQLGKPCWFLLHSQQLILNGMIFAHNWETD